MNRLTVPDWTQQNVSYAPWLDTRDWRECRHCDGTGESYDMADGHPREELHCRICGEYLTNLVEKIKDEKIFIFNCKEHPDQILVHPYCDYCDGEGEVYE